MFHFGLPFFARFANFQGERDLQQVILGQGCQLTGAPPLYCLCDGGTWTHNKYVRHIRILSKRGRIGLKRTDNFLLYNFN
jgi:hypothetical protein